MAPLGSGEGQVPDAGLAGAERVRAVGRHLERAQAAGQDEVEDRQVVRREVPEHVHVGLDEAEVDPHRVDEQDLARARRPRSSSRIFSTAGV